MTSEDLQSWAAGLDELFARVAARFGRVEPRRQARAYLVGLLAPVERKNGWQLAEAAGDAKPHRMQRLLNGVRWDPRDVRADLREYVVEHLGDPGGVLIVDETGFIKKGTASAGVQRQYSGTAGRVENCQLGVFLAYATPRGRVLLDAELYLPKSWTDDRARCAQAGIGDDVPFATKPALATVMLGRALDGAVPASWVAADEAYGQDHKFRLFLEKRKIGYVVAVPRSQSLGAGIGYGNTGSRADAVTADAPQQAWKRLSAGDGAKGPRLYDWAMATLPPHPGDELGGPGGMQRWLLVRRALTPAGDQGEPGLAYYLCFGPAGTGIEQLVRIAGSRWAVEECFQSAKNEVGLDQYQVRRFDAWHRHITLAMLAHAYLVVTAAHAPKARAAWSASPQLRSAVSWHV
ncbi:IS701 family transposase [Spongiactinospora gelatinilytica]|uniref:IS701 family transposase n=1 Tax=Spongiactinospora gelatinilytica TaxID=2666298 RepID=A0A2W2EU62_9ACTN|nr:IS701 family transposase [Spongiactinospora gelatinilytica]PZG17090.1 IS701 family transposase [Spongiactinospora gelatinilytica]